MPTYLHLGNLPIVSANLSFRMRDCDGWRWETHKQSTPTPESERLVLQEHGQLLDLSFTFTAAALPHVALRLPCSGN